MGTVFLVGPGGVGKSTVGRILAARLQYQFCDVDLTFNQRIGMIPDYIRSCGYRGYCMANAELVIDLLAEATGPTVYAMPSGFLVHEDAPDIAEQNRKLLRGEGKTVLLLPSKNAADTADLVVSRLMSRAYTDTTPEEERRRYLSRHPQYIKLGDLKIFSIESPENIAGKITSLLKP